MDRRKTKIYHDMPTKFFSIALCALVIFFVQALDAKITLYCDLIQASKFPLDLTNKFAVTSPFNSSLSSQACEEAEDLSHFLLKAININVSPIQKDH